MTQRQFNKWTHIKFVLWHKFLQRFFFSFLVVCFLFSWDYQNKMLQAFIKIILTNGHFRKKYNSITICLHHKGLGMGGQWWWAQGVRIVFILRHYKILTIFFTDTILLEFPFSGCGKSFNTSWEQARFRYLKTLVILRFFRILSTESSDFR